MEKIEALEKLNELQLLIDNYEKAKEELQNANNNLCTAKYNYLSKLDMFDAEHKSTFIDEKIGIKPVKPQGAIKLAVPVYLVKKSRYESAVKNYEKMYPLAEAAYRETYTSERERLLEEDKIEQQAAIKSSEAVLEGAREKYDSAKVAFEENILLSEKLKVKEIVLDLVEFFKDGRVDTLKEAINLWHDERRKDEEEAKASAHRQEMLELEEERVRAAQAAEDYARMQYEEARDAAEYSRQAAESAREAADTAQRMEWNSYYQSDNPDSE